MTYQPIIFSEEQTTKRRQNKKSSDCIHGQPLLFIRS